MDGKKENYSRYLQCDWEDDSDRSIDGSRIQEPPFELRNRPSRGLSGRLNSTGPFRAGSPVLPFAFVPPPQQPPLAHHPATRPWRSHEEKLAQAQVVKLLAVQEKTRTLVRSISKLLPSADHRQLFHDEVVSKQLHMERHHQSLLKQRLLSVRRALSNAYVPTSGSGMGDYGAGGHHPTSRLHRPSMTQEDYDALEGRLSADLAMLSLGPESSTASLAAATTAQTEIPRLWLDEENPTESRRMNSGSNE